MVLEYGEFSLRIVGAAHSGPASSPDEARTYGEWLTGSLGQIKRARWK
jgi:hypothetical protein